MSWNYLQKIREDFVVDSSIREERVSICKSCEHITSMMTCDVCNCYMPAKTWIKFSNCPIQKWAATSAYIEPKEGSTNE